MPALAPVVSAVGTSLASALPFVVSSYAEKEFQKDLIQKQADINKEAQRKQTLAQVLGSRRYRYPYGGYGGLYDSGYGGLYDSGYYFPTVSYGQF